MLTDLERAEGISRLTQSAAEFEASLAGVTDRQWTFKTSPERWSVEECADHLAVAEELALLLVQQQRQAAETTADSRLTDQELFDRTLDRSSALVAPSVANHRASDGRLRVTYDTRTTFRRLRARATLADADTFLHTYFENAVWPKERPAPLNWSQIPPDYADRIRHVRQRLGLTQAEFASRVGAARKAVVYQWESRKRCPSPLFWERIRGLSAVDSDQETHATTGE
jgi:DNA-binding XRE family transcriptional regulator